jgi:hypothetical protein
LSSVIGNTKFNSLRNFLRYFSLFFKICLNSCLSGHRRISELQLDISANRKFVTMFQSPCRRLSNDINRCVYTETKLLTVTRDRIFLMLSISMLPMFFICLFQTSFLSYRSLALGQDNISDYSQAENVTDSMIIN